MRLWEKKRIIYGFYNLGIIFVSLVNVSTGYSNTNLVIQTHCNCVQQFSQIIQTGSFEGESECT